MNYGFISALSIAAAVSLFSANAYADGNVWDYNITHDDAGHIVIDFEEVKVLLPESWSGKCQMTTSASSVGFFHVASRERITEQLGFETGGSLFTLKVTNSDDWQYEPNYRELAYGNEGFYYVSLPTDVQGYTDDADVMSEFSQMAQDVDWIIENITVTSDTPVVYDDSESFFANSSSVYLSEDDLAGYDADYLQMGINEIYARHHRKFVLENVRSYFESVSWYDGYIEPDDFDPSVMNEYEGANIDLMLRVMNRLTGSSSQNTQTASSDETAVG